MGDFQQKKNQKHIKIFFIFSPFSCQISKIYEKKSNNQVTHSLIMIHNMDYTLLTLIIVLFKQISLNLYHQIMNMIKIH